MNKTSTNAVKKMKLQKIKKQERNKISNLKSKVLHELNNQQFWEKRTSLEIILTHIRHHLFFKWRNLKVSYTFRVIYTKMWVYALVKDSVKGFPNTE